MTKEIFEKDNKVELNEKEIEEVVGGKTFIEKSKTPTSSFESAPLTNEN